MTRDEMIARLREMDACSESLDWIEQTPGEPAALWAACRRSDWMLWLMYEGDYDERVMCHLACDFAEDVLPIFERQHPDDTRPRDAIVVARRYADGDATKEERTAARAAARAAAGAAADAAWVAARAAAWAAADAARAAARAAAGAAADAAWVAARVAARAAAGVEARAAADAAWVAAGTAAWAAAWDAARARQADMIRARVSWADVERSMPR